MINRSSLVIRLMVLYVLIAPLGNLMRFDDEQGAYGVGTIIFLIIIVIAADQILKVILRERVFFPIVLLVIWMMAASFFSVDPISTLIRTNTLILYLLGAAAGFYYLSNARYITIFLLAFCISGLVGGFLTILDFQGLINLPGINEISITTRTYLGRTEQASGFFTERSAMGAYYCMIITGGILASILLKQLHITIRVTFALAAIFCTVALLLTHNRAGILSPGLTVGLILISSVRNPSRLLGLLTIGGIFLLLIVWIVSRWFPDTFLVYQTLFGLVENYDSSSVQESDAIRLKLAEHALSSLLINPFGNGFSLIHNLPNFEYRLFDPHNIFTQIVWGAGIFGLMWLFIVGPRCIMASYKLLSRQTISHVNQVTIVVFGTLLSLLLFDMTHSTLVGVSWFLLGALFRLAPVTLADTGFMPYNREV